MNVHGSAGSPSVPDGGVLFWSRLVWRRRVVVVALVLAAVTVALLYLRFAQYSYTATLNVAPVESSGKGALGQLGGLGSLASLAGITMPGTQSGVAFQLYLENLRSRVTADELARNHDLMRKIFATEWNATRNGWQRPHTIVSRLKSAWLSILGIKGQEWSAPDGARLQEYLERKLQIVQSTKKQMVAISFSHPDPVLARDLLSALHAVVDGQVRRRTLERVDENIAYLAGKLNVVSNVEHQRALADALSEQEKVKMMASSKVAFAAEPFGTPSVTPRPTSPKPGRVLFSAIALGVFFGAGAAVATARKA